MPTIIHYIPHGGVPDQRGFAPAIVAWEFARRMVGAGVLCARDNQPVEWERRDGVEIRRLTMGAGYKRLFTKWTRFDPWPLHARAAAALWPEARLFHAHQLEFPVNDFRRRATSSPAVLVHAHVTNRRFDPGRGIADGYVAVSEYVRHRLIEAGYPPQRIAVVPNGVDCRRFAPMTPPQRAAARAGLGWPEDGVVLLFAGRKQHVKGFDQVLAVAEALLPAYPELTVVVIGNDQRDAERDPHHADTAARRQRLRQHPRFLDVPALPHSQLADAFAAADLALLPSRAEPQGMVMIEAMAAGLPVVSRAVGGITESMVDQISGWLLSDDNTEQAVAAVQALLERPAQRVALGQAARQRATALFDWPQCVARLATVYATFGVVADYSEPDSMPNS